MGRLEIAKKFLHGKSLDVGSNWSDFHRVLDKTIDAGELWGIDLEQYGYRGYPKIVKGNALEMPFKDHSFDSIFCGEILEHMKAPEKLLKECKRVLKKRGVIVLSTPNKKSWLNRILKNNENKQTWLKRLLRMNSMTFHHFLTDKKELTEIFSKFFKVTGYYCIPYNVFSSQGQPKIVYSIRNAVDFFLPEGLREEQVIIGITDY